MSSTNLMNLPTESFAGFATRRLSSPQVSWINAPLFSEQAALANAYCLPLSHEPEDTYLPEEQVQLADRYGGTGVGYCGGSARCGVLGDVQIKGVGKTPLLGGKPNSPPDPWHSSGTLNISEAGREAIWSTICQTALPYGAVPTLAIVLPGTRASTSYVKEGREQAATRTLLLREPALRPAHYLRNLIFHPALRAPDPVGSDSVRTARAINQLAGAYVGTYGLDASEASATELINEGLVRMAERFAAQVAASFAKRIFHGGLGCSNIALDGRYMDFGTMTAVPAYRRRAGAPAPAGPDLWTQHVMLTNTLTKLRVHVSRYLRCPEVGKLIGETELLSGFHQCLQRRTEIEFSKLTGVPESALLEYPAAQRSRLYKCLMEIASRGAKTRFVWWGDGDEKVAHLPPLESTGRYDLNQLLLQVSQSTELDELHAKVQAEIDDTALAREFLRVHADLMTWYLDSQPPQDRGMLLTRTHRNAQRLNADISFLTREAIDEGLAAFEAEPAGLGDFIDQIVSRARWVLDDTVADVQ